MVCVVTSESAITSDMSPMQCCMILGILKDFFNSGTSSGVCLAKQVASITDFSVYYLYLKLQTVN